MEYRILCRYYGEEGDKPVEIIKTDLPDRPRTGELIWIETEASIQLFVVLETVRQFYKLDAHDVEMITNDVHVCEIKLLADEPKTEGEKE